MNNEIKITIIGCAIIFAIVGVLAMNGINPDQVSRPQISEPKSPDNISDDSTSDPIKYPQTTITKIDDNLNIEKTVLIMSIPEDNEFPWVYIKDTIENPAKGYPVIIQLFKSLDEDPVHIAQINLKDNNSFEYKFRIFSIDEGVVTHYFEGDYYIKIFKTVNIQ